MKSHFDTGLYQGSGQIARRGGKIKPIDKTTHHCPVEFSTQVKSKECFICAVGH